MQKENRLVVTIISGGSSKWYEKYIGRTLVVDVPMHDSSFYEVPRDSNMFYGLPSNNTYTINIEDCEIKSMPNESTLINPIEPQPEGRKFDQKKRRWSLLPLEPVRYIVDVLTFGAIKYDDNNWQKVPNGKDRYYSAMMRHIDAHVSGEWLDSEWNLPHLAHAGCCLLFWFWLEIQSHSN